MINARQRLLAHVREFLDRDLNGMVRWDEVTHHDAEPLPNLPDGRRNPLGKHREKVVVEFDGFRLEVSSPEDVPPLGMARLFIDNIDHGSGPLDSATWARLGSVIKEKCHVAS